MAALIDGSKHDVNLLTDTTQYTTVLGRRRRRERERQSEESAKTKSERQRWSKSQG